jgi:hypothetical protein
MNPPGSFPGINNLATAPMIRPMINVQSKCMTTPPQPH